MCGKDEKFLFLIRHPMCYSMPSPVNVWSVIEERKKSLHERTKIHCHLKWIFHTGLPVFVAMTSAKEKCNRNRRSNQKWKILIHRLSQIDHTHLDDSCLDKQHINE